MSDFVSVMTVIVSFLKIPISLYGFTFSFLDLMIWSVFAGLILWFVFRILEV